MLISLLEYLQVTQSEFVLWLVMVVIVASVFGLYLYSIHVLKILHNRLRKLEGQQILKPILPESDLQSPGREKN